MPRICLDSVVSSSHEFNALKKELAVMVMHEQQRFSADELKAGAAD